MSICEPKKMAVIRILQIMQKHSDSAHPLRQEEISDYLLRDYGITLERKAIARNLTLLKEAGYSIESTHNGAYLDEREFTDSELKLLIDSVLSSKHITVKHSKEIIGKLSNLSSRYFETHIKHVQSINEWNKTDNMALFYNIEIVDEAVAKLRRIKYKYVKYGADKKLHITSSHSVSPYMMLVHNQKYYLMGYHHGWEKIIYHRLDKITDMELTDIRSQPLRKLKGYEKGINYKELSSALPYMYTDKKEKIEFIADVAVVDQIIDWFGFDIRISKINEEKVKVALNASPNAMFHWAMQYIEFVEIQTPTKLRIRIANALTEAQEKYK